MFATQSIASGSAPKGLLLTAQTLFSHTATDRVHTFPSEFLLHTKYGIQQGRQYYLTKCTHCIILGLPVKANGSNRTEVYV